MIQESGLIAEPIAVVSCGCLFPGARSPEQFWQVVLEAVDTSRPVPPGRWILPSARILEPEGVGADRVYTDRGCFIDDFVFDPSGFRLPADFLQALDPAFHLALQAARSAFVAARMAKVKRERVGVILGNIVLPTTASSVLSERWLCADRSASASCAKPPTGALEAWNRYGIGLPAGIVAQALGLGGGCYTLDAACASSLYALKLACDELRSGRADAMLAGGLSRPDSLYTQMGFSQLRALSRSGRCAPFDSAASGLIVGEGAGVVVLKRLPDALRHGDSILGVIRGIGLANDLDGNLLSPSSEGQLRALRLAYLNAGWSPQSVQFIECHATGTPVGDAVEFESLAKLWEGFPWRPGQCALGAVKSNIGHLLTAAGSAALIKVLLALQHETLPAVANYQQPAARIHLDGSPFRIPMRSEPWPRSADGTPRRAAINGFGFGGINAHVLIEEWSSDVQPRPRRRRKAPASIPVAIVGMAARVGPWSTLDSFQQRVLAGATGDPSVPATNREASDHGAAPPGSTSRAIAGYYLPDLTLPINRFRIPPRELAEMLPQQALMLEVARCALADTRGVRVDPPRMGIFVGLGLDLRTTDFHLRWSALARGEQIGSPLTADRTMGALAGITASRIAKEFHFGGPSHTVCSEETSGLRALEIAVRCLQQNEADQVLTGAVDITSDPRALFAMENLGLLSTTRASRPFDVDADGAVVGEGAVALVLKRLPDALRDGDRVYAVIQGIGGASGEPQAAPRAKAYRQSLDRAYRDAGVDPDSVAYVETHGSAQPEADRMEADVLTEFFGGPQRAIRCFFGSAKSDVGYAGAAAGLISLIKAALALRNKVLPPIRDLRQPLPALLGSQNIAAPLLPQPWVRNRAAGPRRAGVSALGLDGSCLHVVLEEDPTAPEKLEVELQDRQVTWTSESFFAFAAPDQTELVRQLRAFEAQASPTADLNALGRRWRSQFPGLDTHDCRLALVAQDPRQLLRLLGIASRAIHQEASPGTEPAVRTADRERVFYVPAAQRIQGDIAFVFPGSGNHFCEMGRELGLQWPQILRRLDRENEFLAQQMVADRFWNVAPGTIPDLDPGALICGQVALGTLVSDLAGHFGLQPKAVIGYSLGEATGLFALRAWTARDEMLRRVRNSSLFTHDLAGGSDQLRRAWKVPGADRLEWKVGLVDRSATEVRQAIAGWARIYVLIVNTPQECVIGGDARQVQALLARLGCHWFPVEGVSTVHCELFSPYEAAYRDLHTFPTTPPVGIAFYSGGWGRAYVPDQQTAAEAIVAHARGCIDFPQVIRLAYDSGVRFFLEMGPGNSCTRMIGQILQEQPFLARSLCASAQEPVLTVLRTLGHLFSQGVPFDTRKLHEEAPRALATSEATQVDSPVVRIQIPGPTPMLGRTGPRQTDGGVVAPPVDGVPEQPASALTAGKTETLKPTEAELTEASTPVGDSNCAIAGNLDGQDPFETELADLMLASQAATVKAHEAYLAFSRGLAESFSRAVRTQMGLLASETNVPSSATELAAATDHSRPALPESTLFFDRPACLEFARGSVAKLLGPAFAEVDTYPTRVRLPDEPLMLVDRILEVDGEMGSMAGGRVVTEHDVLPNAWYLDGNRIPTCIAVEAGQADLFLSGYLGIDFHTRGLAVYRLLDARVCFHCGLPAPGAVIRYDIRIERFFRQGPTWLFQFGFEATINGQPFLTMTDGCAGFFTAAELAHGRGIIQPNIERKFLPGKQPPDWQDFVDVGVETYSAEQLNALRQGDFVRCFGDQFAQLRFERPLTLPDGRMKLVHRIVHLDPAGGHFGLGTIRGEADIHSTDWFLTCHFVDDRVMPGTLMFECCLHTLRVFLLRLGWVAEQDQVALEPVPELMGQLKCRGQVLETTLTVAYEVSIKEIGYRPEPYVIADALMYADGKPIVEIHNMSLRYSGITRETLCETWSRSQDTEKPDRDIVAAAGAKRAIYERNRILAFAVGKPSEAFGPPYRVFDEGRRIARLPGPPFQFLDRITEVHGEPFKLVAGSSAEAEYAVPPDAWYFAENRQDDMPFVVLLEIALQPCGWLAAYLGSALLSEADLSFRNLGGVGTQYLAITPRTGTLKTRAKLTRFSRSAGMILQWFDFEVSAGTGLIYRGDTYFGFFPKEALLRQEGLRDAKLYPLPEDQPATPMPYPTAAPFAGERLRMLDEIEVFLPKGGPHHLGFAKGRKQVRPEDWFFKAHFYQDPVVPGSLGLESFVQLLKFIAVQRWGHIPGSRWEGVSLGQKHTWIYRGQILPTDHQIVVEAGVTMVNDAEQSLAADGFLSLDGRVIYGMKNFTVRRQPALRIPTV